MTKNPGFSHKGPHQAITRRQFGALTGGAALLAGLVPRAATATPVQKLVLSIRDFGQQNSRLIKAGAQQYAQFRRAAAAGPGL